MTGVVRLETKIKTSMIIPLLIIVALVANFLFTQTWLALGVLTAIYTLLIPYGILRFIRDKKLYKEYLKATGNE